MKRKLRHVAAACGVIVACILLTSYLRTTYHRVEVGKDCGSQTTPSLATGDGAEARHRGSVTSTALSQSAIPRLSQVSSQVVGAGGGASENTGMVSPMAPLHDSVLDLPCSSILSLAFEHLRNDIAGELPTNVFSLRELMQMNVAGFESSEDAELQSYVATHNRKMMSILSSDIRGTCQWNTGGRAPHRITFQRQGFIVRQSCSCGAGEISNGVGVYGERWDADCIDSLYLSCLATFDPKNFTSLERCDISVPRADGTAERRGVVRVDGKSKALFFDSTGILIRILYKKRSGKSPVQVDLLNHAKINGLEFPTRVRLSFLGRSGWKSPVPEYMDLDVDLGATKLVVTE